MNNKSSTFFSFVLIIVALLAFTGCNVIDPFFSFSTSRGSLVLQIDGNKVESRTILPEISMDIESYTISGSGPNGETFSDDITDSTIFTKSNLAKGSWTITVEAYNAGTESSDPVLIGEGEKTITILPAVLNEKSIIVSPVSGTGAFELTATWTEALSDPSLTYTLTTASNDAWTTTEEFLVSGQEGTLNIASIDNGYYVLEVTLMDGGSPIGYAADSLRIVAGETTSGILEMSLDDTGDFELSISPQMDDPFSIELSGGEATLTLGSDMTVTATPSESVDSYAWYLNGLRLTGETSNSITLGADLAEGNYTLTSMVWKGNVVCSESYSFSINSEIVLFVDDFEGGDLSNWTIGGRREGTNETDVVLRNGTKVAYLYQAEFSEILLEKTFPVADGLHFQFDMEIEVNSNASSTSDFYASAGVHFEFLDSEGTLMGVVGYIKSTSTYPFRDQPSTTYPTTRIYEDGVINYNISLEELLNQLVLSETPSEVKVVFQPYTSGWPYNMWGKVWFDNVKVYN